MHKTDHQSTCHSMSGLAVLFAMLVCWLSPKYGLADDGSADLVLHHGKVATLDKMDTMAEALAARGGRIVFVGDNAGVRQWMGPQTRIINLRGRLVIPGLIEGHAHFVGLGRSKMILDLSHAETWNDIVDQVGRAAEVTLPGQWIIGRGWHQAKWQRRPEDAVSGYPHHQRLSDRTPNHPVLLTHASGHALAANSAAMKLAGVNPQTPDPRGGRILRDSHGKPVGVFLETAQALIHRRRSTIEDRETSRAIELATQACLSNGITSFHDAGSSFATIDVFRDLAFQQELKIRLWVMVRASNEEMDQRLSSYRMIGAGDHCLTVRAIKRSIDGALGSHGAWLLQPYDDLPTSVGLNTATVSSIRRSAELALAHDYQLCVHAIGDRANRETLDVFQDVLKSDRSRRWRIEHAQHLHPDDIPRFAELGVIAAMQGIHCPADAVFVFARLGQRRAAEGAYVWQSLLNHGTTIVNGTDAPVEDLDPFACLHASVTRKLRSGEAFYPNQSMTRMQALRSYTTAAAYAAFEEDIKGSLETGKLADLVVLSRDILTCPVDEIPNTHVLFTIVGGRVMYAHKTQP